MSIYPTKPLSLTRQVAEQLRRHILEARYEPGQRFATEAEVARQFSVSRAIASEAVSRLMALGILECHRHSGLHIG